MKNFEVAFGQALSRRSELLKSSDTDCFRLFCGELEGVPGFIVEKWADLLIGRVVEKHFPFEWEAAEQMMGIARQMVGCPNSHLRLFVENRNQPSQSFRMSRVGEEREEVTVCESGLRFLIRPEEPFSPGLFMDQRNHRSFLALRCAGKRMLNLFAYTCAFSVCALRGGASDVVSVDLSRRYLSWGKRNQELNGLGGAPHRVIADDVRDVLRRLMKREETFDRIVIDPPTFSRGKRGSVFRVEEDAEVLIESAKRILAPNGEIFFSTNYEGWEPKNFRALRETALSEGSFKVIALPPTPLDFEQEVSTLKAFLIKRLT